MDSQEFSSIPTGFDVQNAYDRPQEDDEEDQDEINAQIDENLVRDLGSCMVSVCGIDDLQIPSSDDQRRGFPVNYDENFGGRPYRSESPRFPIRLSPDRDIRTQESNIRWHCSEGRNTQFTQFEHSDLSDDEDRNEELENELRKEFGDENDSLCYSQEEFDGNNNSFERDVPNRDSNSNHKYDETENEVEDPWNQLPHPRPTNPTYRYYENEHFIRNKPLNDQQDLNYSGNQMNIEHEVDLRAQIIHPSDQQKFLSTNSDEELQLLYTARGREIDKLTNQLEEEIRKNKIEMRDCNLKIQLLSQEKSQYEASSSQYKSLYEESEEKYRSSVQENTKLNDRIVNYESDIAKIKLRLETRESEISCLEDQVKELQKWDTLAKSRKMHDDLLQKVKDTNKSELDLIKTKLTQKESKLIEKEQEFQNLTKEMQDLRLKSNKSLAVKTEQVKRLTEKLETSETQCTNLLEFQTNNVQLRIRTNELEELNASKERKIKVLQDELNQAKDSLKNFEFALKFDTLKDVIQPDNSTAELGLKRTLNFDETTKDLIDNIENKISPPKKDSSKNIEELSKNFNIVLQVSENRSKEISRLNEKIFLLEGNFRKVSAELKSSKIEKETLEKSLKELNSKEAKDMLSKMSEEKNDANQIQILKENLIKLKEELANSYEIQRELKKTSVDLDKLVTKISGKVGKSQENNDLINELITAMKSHQSISISSENSKIELLDYLRNENAKLQASSETWNNHLKIIIEALKMITIRLYQESETRTDHQTDLSILKQTADKFYFYAQNFQKSMDLCFEENASLRNELSSSNLEIEKLKIEISELKRNHENSSEANQFKIAKENENLESYKQNFMTFHDNAIKTLEKQILAEYNGIINELKSQLLNCQDELTQAKELYIELSKEKREIETQIDLKACGVDCQSNVKEQISRLQEEHERLLRDTVQSYQDKIKNISEPKDKIREKLSQSAATQTYPKENEEKSSNNDSILVQIHQHSTEQTKLISSLRQEKIDQRNHYDSEINELKEKYKKLLHKSQEEVINAKSGNSSSEKDKISSLKSRIKELESEVVSLSEENVKQTEFHEEITRNMTDEVTKLESKINEIGLNKEQEKTSFVTCLDELRSHLAKTESEKNVLAKQYDNYKTKSLAKMKEITEKFQKLKEQYYIRKEQGEKRVEHYMNEANRIYKESDEKRINILEHFQKWASDGTSYFSKLIEEIMKEIINHKRADELQYIVSQLKFLKERIDTFQIKFVK